MVDCVVVGGGISGLTAAVELAQSGVHVTLVERAPHLGGRAYSFQDDQSGAELDNGQHLIMGCYTSFLKFLTQIGSLHKLYKLPHLRIAYRHLDGRSAALTADRYSYPFSLLSAVLRFELLSRRTRWSVIRFMSSLRYQSTQRIDGFESISAYELLHRSKQASDAIDILWQPLCLATLNLPLRFASARMFAIVLRTIFFGGADASSIYLTKTGLSELYVEDARRFIEFHGGRCLTSNGVTEILWNDSRAIGVVLSDGGTIETSNIILAVPPRDTLRLMPTHMMQPQCREVDRFRTSEIRSYHLWSSQQITDEPMTGLIGTRLQWLFAKGKVSEQQWMYSCVISAADMPADSPDDDAEAVRGELRRLFPHLRHDAVTRVRRIRERRATINLAPGIETIRPPCRTASPNVMLAGDWTATSLPATLEGAVRSGYTAAHAVRDSIRDHRQTHASVQRSEYANERQHSIHH